MPEPILLVGIAAFILLLVRAVAQLIDWSLKLVSTVLVALGVGSSQVVHIETVTGETVSLADAIIQGWVADGFPVPEPVVTADTGQTLGELAMAPITWEVFAAHLVAAVIVVVVTYGLMESSWFLGLLGGVFTAALTLWLDYWYVVYGDSAITTAEFGTWTFAAAAGGILGLIGTILVAEPVFDQETREEEVDLDEVLINVEG